MTSTQSVSIWFFIGVLLLFYGLLITGAGLFALAHPPHVALAHLNASLWWGLLLIAIGGGYSYAFFPWRKGRKE